MLVVRQYAHDAWHIAILLKILCETFFCTTKYIRFFRARGFPGFWYTFLVSDILSDYIIFMYSHEFVLSTVLSILLTPYPCPFSVVPESLSYCFCQPVLPLPFLSRPAVSASVNDASTWYSEYYAVTDAVTSSSCEWVGERVSKWVNELDSCWVSEWVSEYLGWCVSGWLRMWWRGESEGSQRGVRGESEGSQSMCGCGVYGSACLLYICVYKHIYTHIYMWVCVWDICVWFVSVSARACVCVCVRVWGEEKKDTRVYARMYVCGIGVG